MDETWFEMRDTTRVKLAAGVWIPLRIADEQRHGHYPQVGHWTDRHDVNTAAVALADRQAADALRPGAFSGEHRHDPDAARYRSIDVAYHHDWDAGIHLALAQSFFTGDPEVWTLHPDLVFALGLKQEGDVWLRPQEGYCEVAQLRRKATGEPYGLFIRPEFLRDYLAARSMALHIYQSRHRRAVLIDADPFGWDGQAADVDVDGGQLCRQTWATGNQIRFLNLYRTDQWGEDELPVLGDIDENSIVEEGVIEEPGPAGHALDAWFERREWLEPAASSPRVRGDPAPSPIEFITHPSGETTPATALNDEDVGRWLWFSPGVIPELLSRRGVSIRWTGEEVAAVKFAGSYEVPFGDNARDKVVVYARDIARLDVWEQSIWSGFNVSPDGGLPHGLTLGGPLDKAAPEALFAHALAAVDVAGAVRWGRPLFRDHDEADAILGRIHRFRALDPAGLLSLAKDIARLTVDRLDTALLWEQAPLEKGERRGSLKSLERALGAIVPPQAAHALMAALFGVYDLRLADAHLPSAALAQALERAGVDGRKTPLKQARDLLRRTGLALLHIALTLYPEVETIDPESALASTPE